MDSTGARTNAPDVYSYQQFKKFNSTFSGISGSIGATYQFSEYIYIKLNAARGYRAPSIGEAGAYGEHEGTGRFEIGNPKLKAESSLQFDAAFGLNTEHLTLELDIFQNRISNFIFLQKLNNMAGGDSLSQGITTFEFVQASAELTGGEITVDIHPHPVHWLHIENSFSYVQAIQKGQADSLKYLPFTPAPKLVSDIKADIKKIGKHIINAYIKAEIENYFDQNKFYSAYGTETKTSGYTLFNFGVGSDFIQKQKTIFIVYISANNITGAAYQNHLSRLKYTAPNNVTGRTGVYNMGRNISFKLIVPLEFKK